MISFHAFSDEFIKIAEWRDTAMDKSKKEMASKRLNKEKFKQFLGNTALVAGGTAVGYGGAELVRAGLKKFRGSPHSRVRQAISLGLPLVGGASVIGYKQQLDKEKKRTLEEAYRRGVSKGQRDA